MAIDVCNLYDIAEAEDIDILPFSLPETGSLSIMSDSGKCYIGMDNSISDNGTQERVHLAHELGHCITGSFYNIYAAIDYRQRHENRADKWAISKLIPVTDLDDAVAEGYCEVWDLADYFGVTEDFVKKAVCYYIHGNVATDLYF